MNELTIRLLEEQDVLPMADAFAALGWDKTEEQFRRYLAEQEAGMRVTPVAFLGGQFVGYLNVVWEAHYPPFREASIPEIQDFNVLPDHRRQGIGSRLMDEAERIAGTRSDVVGIGVGLYVDYGTAQRLYVRRGYIPDGRGIYYDNRPVAASEMARVDDSLTLQLTRRMR